MDGRRDIDAALCVGPAIDPNVMAIEGQMVVLAIVPSLPKGEEVVLVTGPEICPVFVRTTPPSSPVTGTFLAPNPPSVSGRRLVMRWTWGLPGTSWYTQSATIPRARICSETNARVSAMFCAVVSSTGSARMNSLASWASARFSKISTRFQNASAAPATERSAIIAPAQLGASGGSTNSSWIMPGLRE